jgi:hypothetical protein
MSLLLRISTDAWREHHAAVLGRYPDLVPVAKGNGYGFGNVRLAAEAARLGVDTLAAGTLTEARELLPHFEGRIIVLTPYLPGDEVDDLPERVVSDVASIDALRKLPNRRVVIDCMTGMRRHGITPDDVEALRDVLADREVDGFAVHLPLDRPAGVDPVADVAAWLDRLAAAGVTVGTMFVSHLTAHEVSELSARYPDVAIRPRIATELWLGAKDALHSRATVLDVHPIARGQRFGYRQRPARADGHLVIVAGGTAHGVGLESPKILRGAGARAKSAARSLLALANRSLSPFSWQGRQLWFAEPPHMIVSMLFVPAGVTPPAPGDELDATLRHTTTWFDRVVDA